MKNFIEIEVILERGEWDTRTFPITNKIIIDRDAINFVDYHDMEIFLDLDGDNDYTKFELTKESLERLKFDLGVGYKDNFNYKQGFKDGYKEGEQIGYDKCADDYLIKDLVKEE